jgi:predicted transcriptional regulator
MSYDDLRSQAFDDIPNTLATNSTSEIDFSKKLLSLADQPDDVRRTFFANLDSEKWEDCGDVFVEQFGAMVKKMKEARRERRRIAEEFEEEIAKRNEIVEASKEQLGERLQQMKAGGMSVLQGRTARM